MNYDAYAKGANRGDFQYEVIEYDDFGGVEEESCKYKGESVGVSIRKIDGGFCVEINGLLHKPYDVIDEIRKTKSSARKLVERIIRNDRENNGKGNEKFVYE